PRLDLVEPGEAVHVRERMVLEASREVLLGQRTPVAKRDGQIVDGLDRRPQRHAGQDRDRDAEVLELLPAEPRAHPRLVAEDGPHGPGGPRGGPRPRWSPPRRTPRPRPPRDTRWPGGWRRRGCPRARRARPCARSARSRGPRRGARGRPPGSFPPLPRSAPRAGQPRARSASG